MSSGVDSINLSNEKKNVGNKTLNKSKKAANNDEFYTTYETVSSELAHYVSQLNNKTVLCNCDDPFESAFSNYFIKNFNKIGLRRLICTSYCSSKMINSKGSVKDISGELLTPGQGYVMDLTSVPKNIDESSSDSDIDLFLTETKCVKKLDGTGAFSSAECVEYLKQSDAVITNPPFSLFREIVELILQYKKQFLLIGNSNALLYKEIFPLIQNNQAWIGYHYGEMAFKVPADSEPKKYRYWQDSTGQKWRSLGNAMWLTNIDIERRHMPLSLTQIYDPGKYPKFDNYDAIEVSRVADIPLDYPGIMAVPITFLNKHCTEQFEIVGEANHGSDNPFDLFKPTINGVEIYKRLLIRHSNNKLKSSQQPKDIRDFVILDLFCGCGGFSYGMHKNPRFKTGVAVDNDPAVGLTFKNNMPDAEVIIGDLTSSDLKKQIIESSRKKGVNMIIGGPPCQGFSNKGKKLGLEDPRNFLFKEYLELVKSLQPAVFVIENVKTLLSASNGWFKSEIVNTINLLGYKVSYGVLNAKYYGVPQSRERAIFICSKNEEIPLPAPSVTNFVTVRDAIEDLAYLESNEGDFEQDYITDAKTEYQRLMRKSSKKLFNHKASNHKQIAIDKLRMIPPEKGKEFIPEDMRGNQQFRGTWGRLVWDDVSPTIDTRFDAASNGTNNHPFLNRAITPREAARIQSFDDSFIFYGSKIHVRKQVGNAVPPLLAKAIADQIASTLSKGEQ